MWGRQSYRLSPMDFEANVKDGHGVDWPIRYEDVAPWYDHVEKFIGVSGNKDGFPQLPDGQFQPPMEMNCVEKEVKRRIETNYSNRKMTIGRVANLTEALPGRSKCNYRNMCSRGCPFGAYFSSNSSTLPAAMDTGNTTLRPDSIVESILYDNVKEKAVGVRVVDANTLETTEYKARVIFVCASTIPTTGILLNSKSDRFPNGLGNDSGTLGHYLMDHFSDISSTAEYDGPEFISNSAYGGRPNGIYIPRFRNVDDQRHSLRRSGHGAIAHAAAGAIPGLGAP